MCFYSFVSVNVRFKSAGIPKAPLIDQKIFNIKSYKEIIWLCWKNFTLLNCRLMIEEKNYIYREILYNVKNILI